MAGYDVKREYPPAVQVHTQSCPDVISARDRGEVFMPMGTRDIATTYPNGRMHSCHHFSPFPQGVVQPMIYPPHAYEASSVIHSDATRALCSVCMGTHATIDALLLPPGMQGSR